jgi:copper resistance protein C
MKNILYVVIVLFAISANPSYAHTTVKASNVEDGKHYEVAPESIDITFGADVGLAAVELMDRTNKAIEIDFKKPKGMKSVHSVAIPPLEKNGYTLFWRAIAKDGHIMTGQINFTISASEKVKVTCTPGHAAMGHCTMPSAPERQKVECTEDHAAMGRCTMPTP